MKANYRHASPPEHASNTAEEVGRSARKKQKKKGTIPGL